MPIIRIEDRPFIKAADPKTIIWRYMEFPKFSSLLLSQALFFCRLDKFENDPWEGLFTEKNLDRNRLIGSFQNKGRNRGDAEKGADRYIDDLRAFQKHRNTMAVSCWHMNDSESDIFWRIYSRMDEGVAIRSTVSNLEAALHPQEKREVLCSEITYLDYEKASIPPGNSYNPALCKRASFIYENEFRAIIDSFAGGPFASASGETVPVDLNKLILEVVVSPLAPAWFFNNTKDLISRMGFKFPCAQSNLLRPLI